MDLRDAHAIRDAVNSGKISAREAVEAALRRIEEVDGDLGGFLTIDSTRVLERADMIDRSVREQALPLAGVPIE